MKSKLFKLVILLLYTGILCAQNNILKDNFGGKLKKDEITRGYITPLKIVTQSNNTENSFVRNSEVLLTDFDGQLSTNGSGMCVLKSDENQNSYILLDYGHEFYGSIEIAAAIRGGSNPINVRIRFGESVSEAMSDCIDNSTPGMQSATNEHSLRDFTIGIPWLGTVEVGNSGFRFVRIDLLDKDIDPRFGVYEIGELVETGVNVVELSVEPMSIYAEIAPIYILGDFALQSASAGWIIIEPAENLGLGSWKTQGHPYYSWDVSYSKSYTIKDLSAQYTLQLKEWNGTLSEVYVNGSKVGLIAYKPYEFDLSPYLKKGKNNIEVRVVGSLKNLLGPHYNQDKGIASPWHWNDVHRQNPGKDYNLLDYGLMKDFIVVSHKE